MVTLIPVFVLFAFGSDFCEVIRRAGAKLPAFFIVIPRKMSLILLCGVVCESLVKLFRDLTYFMERRRILVLTVVTFVEIES
jgi:hypothetical protein